MAAVANQDMDQVFNLFLGLLTNLTGSSSLPKITSDEVSVRDDFKCEGDWIRDEITVDIPLALEPSVFGPKSGSYKCGAATISILVTVYETATSSNWTEEALEGETLTLNCSLTLWKKQGETQSNMSMSDTINKLTAQRNDYTNIGEDEMLNVISNRTTQTFGSDFYYCKWNLSVFIGDEDFKRNFAVIISMHVKVDKTEEPKGEDEAKGKDKDKDSKPKPKGEAPGPAPGKTTGKGERAPASGAKESVDTLQVHEILAVIGMIVSFSQ